MRGKSGYRCNSIIAILPVLMLVGLYVLEFNTGHVWHVETKFGETKIYGYDDLREAAGALKCHFFLHMPGYELRELSYDEELVGPELDAMQEEERISKREDAVILESVYVKVHSYDGSGDCNKEQTGRWILIRDGITGKWRVKASACGCG